MLSYLLTYIPLVLLVISAVADSRPRSVHKSIAKRRSGDLAKRFSSARWSFYDAGLGACGQYNSGSDFIVALNAEQFGSGYPGPNCFKKITMTYNGKTATATIMDRCPGCPYGGLDLTRGLFSYFASQDQGIIYGEWSIIGEGGAAAPATSPSVWVSLKAWAAPTTSSEVPPTTSSVWVAPTTSRAWAASTTSSKAWVPPTTLKAWVAPTASITKLWVAPTTSSSSVWAPSPSSSPSSPSTKTKTKTSSAASGTGTSAPASTSAIALVASSAATSGKAVSTAAATKNVNTATGNNIEKANNLFADFGQLLLSAGLVHDAVN